MRWLKWLVLPAILLIPAFLFQSVAVETEEADILQVYRTEYAVFGIVFIAAFLVLAWFVFFRFIERAMADKSQRRREADWRSGFFAKLFAAVAFFPGCYVGPRVLLGPVQPGQYVCGLRGFTALVFGVPLGAVSFFFGAALVGSILDRVVRNRRARRYHAILDKWADKGPETAPKKPRV